MKLFSNQCQENKWRPPAVPPSQVCHDCLITSLPERGDLSAGCSGADFICSYRILENPNPAWSPMTEAEAPRATGQEGVVGWRWGRGPLRKRGHRVPEGCCFCSYPPPNRASDIPHLGREAVLSPSRLPLKGLHGTAGTCLGP